MFQPIFPIEGALPIQVGLDFNKQSAFNFTRASQGIYADKTGAYQLAPSNTPRYDHVPVGQAGTGTFKGVLMEGACTNKCTNVNLNPTDFTNMNQSGSAVFSVVDDTTALAAAGLAGVATNNKVFKIDNSASGGSSTVQVIGAVGNTNPHTLSCFVRVDSGGTAGFRLEPSLGLVETTSTSYSRLVSTVTPGGTTARFQMRVPAGSVGYFVLNQLEESSAVSSPVVTAGATATREADSMVLLHSMVSGVVVCAMSTFGATGTDRTVCVIDDGDDTGDNSVRVMWESGDTAVTTRAFKAGVEQVALTGVNAQEGVVAIKVASDTLVTLYDAGAVVAESTDSMPTGLTRITFGQLSAGGSALCGHIKGIYVYDKVLNLNQMKKVTQL